MTLKLQLPRHFLGQIACCLHVRQEQDKVIVLSRFSTMPVMQRVIVELLAFRKHCGAS